MKVIRDSTVYKSGRAEVTAIPSIIREMKGIKSGDIIRWKMEDGKFSIEHIPANE